MKRISAGLDEGVNQGECEDGDVWIAVIGETSYGHCCFPRGVGFLSVDVLCDLEMDCIVGFLHRRIARTTDEYVERRDFEPTGRSTQHHYSKRVTVTQVTGH